jgi:hypothetical protein
VFAREVGAGGNGIDVKDAIGAGLGFSGGVGWIEDGLFFSLMVSLRGLPYRFGGFTALNFFCLLAL